MVEAELEPGLDAGDDLQDHFDEVVKDPSNVVRTEANGSSFTSMRIVYGEAAPNAAGQNLRGRVYRTYDGAGLLEHEAFDIDGNLARHSRRVAAAYDITPDWSSLDGIDDTAAMDAAAAAVLDAETFTTEATFDAMGRPVSQTTPDASAIRFGYGDAGVLETVAANVRGAVNETTYVEDLRYNARGQRTLVAYGNGTRTTYAHDPQTFRLTQLRTERVSDGHLHQDLQYTYDSVGNIVEIRDGAQPVVFTSNVAVSADQRFEYDALYRLVHAEGREHQSQGQPTADDFVPRVSPDDPTALRSYTEQYLYDAVGNIRQLQHAAVGGSWTRRYDYGDHSQGHRLQATSAAGDPAGVFSQPYAHDAHGNMTAMPHLAAIEWDHGDRMQSADLGGGGAVFFQYDAAGQRVRKVRRNQAGTSTWERIYVGGYEVYRETVGGELRLERQTLHVGDDAGRVCVVETKTVDDGNPVASPTTIHRYQYGNHLCTVGLELDDTGQLVSYEEFHPYGTTAYRAANSTLDVSASRYRYTGKERDEETGLGYHGARYYASWLGRWTAADPIGLGDGINRFAYARGSPVVLHDPSGTASESALPAIVQRQAMLLGQIAATGKAGGDVQPLLDKLDAVNAEFAAYAHAEKAQRIAEARADIQRRAVARAESFVGSVETGGIGVGDVLYAATAPHRFLAGSVVGFAERSAQVAVAPAALAYGLATDASGTASTIGEGIADTYDEYGPLGFTPLPSLVANVEGIATADNAFDAGRSHGHAGVDAVETAAIVHAGGRAALGQLEKSLATRGVLLEDLGAGAGGSAGAGAVAEEVSAAGPAAEGGGPTEVLDTNVVVGKGKDFVGTGAVQSEVSPVEIRALVAKGKLKGSPKAAGEIPTVQLPSLDTRINVRGALSPGRKGNFADGIIGGTALDLKVPLVTFDKDLTRAIRQLGGTVRKP